MPQISETPPGVADGVSCNQLGGWLHDSLTFSAYRAQHLIAKHGIRPDLAATVASFAFGGAHG